MKAKTTTSLDNKKHEAQRLAYLRCPSVRGLHGSNQQAQHEKVSILEYIFIYCLPYLYLRFVRKIPLTVQIILFPIIIVGFILDTLFHALVYAVFRLRNNKGIVRFYQKYYNRLQVNNEKKKSLMIHIQDIDHNGYITSILGVAGIYAITKELSSKYNIIIRHFSDINTFSKVGSEILKETQANNYMHILYAHGCKYPINPFCNFLRTYNNDLETLQRSKDYIKKVNEGRAFSGPVLERLKGYTEYNTSFNLAEGIAQTLIDERYNYESLPEEDKRNLSEYLTEQLDANNQSGFPYHELELSICEKVDFRGIKSHSNLVYWGCYTEDGCSFPNYVGSKGTVLPGGRLDFTENDGQLVPQVTFICL